MDSNLRIQISHYFKSQISNLKSAITNPSITNPSITNPSITNPQSKIRNPKTKIGNPKSEIRKRGFA